MSAALLSALGSADVVSFRSEVSLAIARLAREVAVSSTGLPFLRRRSAFLDGGSGSATSTSISSGRGSRLRFLLEVGVSSVMLSGAGSEGS